MNHIESDTFYQLPGVQGFLEEIVEVLAKGRSLLLLVPLGIDADEVWEVIWSHLWRNSFMHEAVSLSDLPANLSPVAALNEALGLSIAESGYPPTIEQLLSEELSIDIIRLTGIEALCEDMRHQWTEFLSLWAQTSQGRVNVYSEYRIPAFCLIISSNIWLTTLPASNVFLEVRWWWGFPSILETQLLCRNNGLELDSKAQWREQVLPSIASGDIHLLDFLWDNLDIDLDNLIDQLCFFAQARGWSQQQLYSWGIKDFDSISHYSSVQHVPSPPVSMRQLWSQGAMIRTVEYGYELHSAALAVIDDRDGVSHRLWRGQSRLLLPFVDHIRLTICKYATEKYGSDWPVRWWLPPEGEEEAVRNNPLACQWGHLVTLFKRGHLKVAKKRWYDVALQAHQMRNRIAHYHPVLFQEYENLRKSLDQAIESDVR